MSDMTPEDREQAAEVERMIYALHDASWQQGYEAAVHEHEITSVADVFELGRKVGATCGPGVRVEQGDPDWWDAYMTGWHDGVKPCNLRHRRNRRVYGQRPPARPGVRSSAR